MEAVSEAEIGGTCTFTIHTEPRASYYLTHIAGGKKPKTHLKNQGLIQSSEISLKNLFCLFFVLRVLFCIFLQQGTPLCCSERAVFKKLIEGTQALLVSANNHSN